MTDALHPAFAQRDFWLDETVWQEADPAHLVTRLIALLREAGIPLQRVNVAVSALHPEIIGFALIWKRKTGRIERVTGDRDRTVSLLVSERSPFRLVIGDGIAGIRRRLDRADCPDDFDMLAELRGEGATDYVVIATGSAEAGIGGMISTWTTDRAGGFTTPELVAIAEHARLLGHVLAAFSARQTARNLVDTYIGHRAGGRILSGDIVRGRSTSLEAAIWLSDIRDFTTLSERLPADALLKGLNAHFDTVIKPVQAHGGEVLKLMGDAVLAVFPADRDGGPAAACAAALAAAREARVATARHADGTPETTLRYVVALHFGTVSFGNVGASNRLDFTVIGPAVNLVSRLNALGKRLDREIVMSAAFAGHCGGTPVSLGAHSLRGLAGRHEIFAPEGSAA